MSAPRPASKGLLARGLKLLGHLTHPDTKTGKVFVRVEGKLIQITGRIAESPTYLRFSGGLMRRRFALRVRRHALLERMLHSLRLPSSSEVDVLRDQLRRIGDQVEALGSQLELVVDLLERQPHRMKPREPAKEPAAGDDARRPHVA